ncbi:MAG: hypothetical protein NXI01_09475 [Gammaproteobacteria bacterium]|nr:hypothetical protein [Gammaproteobacteria bacterium]
MNAVPTLRWAFFLGSLSCISLCMATPILDESDALQLTTHFNNLTSIACDHKAQHCVATGFVLEPTHIDHLAYTTNDGGVTWHTGSPIFHSDDEVAPQYAITSVRTDMQIKCGRSGMNCLIAKYTLDAGLPYVQTYMSHNGGTSWDTHERLPLYKLPKELNEMEDLPHLNLQCDTTGKKCIIGAHFYLQKILSPVFYTTQDGGQSWSDAIFLTSNKPETTVDLLYALRCDDTGMFCTAITNRINNDTDNPTPRIHMTQDAGLTWTTKPMLLADSSHEKFLVSTEDSLSDLSCDHSNLHCIALGSHIQISEKGHSSLHNYAYVTQNGGVTWEHAVEIDPEAPAWEHIFTTVRCDSSDTFCIAIGSSAAQGLLQPIIYISIDGGYSWQQKPFQSPAGSTVLLDAFCADTGTLCHAVGLEVDKAF